MKLLPICRNCLRRQTTTLPQQRSVKRNATALVIVNGFHHGTRLYSTSTETSFDIRANGNEALDPDDFIPRGREFDSIELDPSISRKRTGEVTSTLDERETDPLSDTFGDHARELERRKRKTDAKRRQNVRKELLFHASAIPDTSYRVRRSRTTLSLPFGAVCPSIFFYSRCR